ncbi:hypothetical protein CCHR01_16881, partial [Colletotrichum chrysophilum]
SRRRTTPTRSCRPTSSRRSASRPTRPRRRRTTPTHWSQRRRSRPGSAGWSTASATPSAAWSTPRADSWTASARLPEVSSARARPLAESDRLPAALSTVPARPWAVSLTEPAGLLAGLPTALARPLASTVSERPLEGPRTASRTPSAPRLAVSARRWETPPARLEGAMSWVPSAVPPRALATLLAVSARDWVTLSGVLLEALVTPLADPWVASLVVLARVLAMLLPASLEVWARALARSARATCSAVLVTSLAELVMVLAVYWAEFSVAWEASKTPSRAVVEVDSSVESLVEEKTTRDFSEEFSAEARITQDCSADCWAEAKEAAAFLEVAAVVRRAVADCLDCKTIVNV